MGSTAIPVLEIGGTHVTAAVVETGTWQVVAGTGVRRSIDPRGPADTLIATMVEAGRSLRPDDGSLWGVAIPGPFDYVRGIADFHGVGKFDALRGVDLGDVLRRTLTRANGRVSFVNDAEAFAIGEWASGAAQGHHRMIGVTLGTGVGSAFLVDGVAQRRGPGVAPDGRLDLVQVDGRPLRILSPDGRFGRVMDPWSATRPRHTLTSETSPPGHAMATPTRSGLSTSRSNCWGRS